MGKILLTIFFLLLHTSVYADFNSPFSDFGTNHAGMTFTDTGSFVGVLGASDTTVQLSLQTLSSLSGLNTKWSSLLDPTEGLTLDHSGYDTVMDNVNDITFDGYSGIELDSGMTFIIEQDGVKDDILTINGTTGRVGVGTSTPTTDLDVRGDAVFLSTAASGVTISNAPLKVGDTLQVGNGSLYASFYSDEGDIYSHNGKLYAGGGMNTVAERYGVGLQVRERALTKTLPYDVDATFTAATAIIEKAGQTFVTDGIEVDDFMILTDGKDSGGVDYTGSCGEIIKVTETQITVSIAAAGSDVPNDLTGVDFVAYSHPIAAILDNGDIHFNVGVSADASFKIHADDSNNDHAVHIVSTSGVDNNRGLDIDYDSDGYNIGVAGRFNYVSGALVDGDVGGGLFVTLDDTEIVAASGSTILGGIAISTTTASDAVKRGVVVLPGFTEAVVIQGATAIAPSYASEVTVTVNYDRVNGTGADGTAFLSTSSSNLTIFDNDNDYILIGDDNTFEDIEVNLVTGGGRTIIPTFWYPNAGDGTWVSLPIQGDGTNGFQSGGNIIFNAPVDWTKDDEDMDGNAIVDAYYVAIVRTRNNLANKPVEDHFHIFADQDTGATITGVGAMKPIEKAADPCADTTQYPVGAMFYNSTSNYPCFCNESNVARKMTDQANCY